MPLARYRVVVFAPKSHRCRHRRGASTVEVLVVVGLVALAAVGAFVLFQKNVSGTTKCQGDQVASLGGQSGCGPASAQSGPVAIASANVKNGPAVDANGPICDRMGRCSGGGNCFAAGTKIATANGLVDIESVHEGDRVLSASADDASAESMRPVEHVVVTKDREVLELDVRVGANVELIKVTPDHAFWVDERGGWVRSKDLAIGARVHSGDGASAEVVARRLTGERATVYNLEVAEVHAYFAGASRLLGRYTCERLPATDALRAEARKGELWQSSRFEAIDKLAACKGLTADDYKLLADAAHEEAAAKARYSSIMRSKGHAAEEITAATARPWFGRAAEAVRAGAAAAAPGANEALQRL